MTNNKNDHIILGISGRAQSGKTTLANHIVEELSYGGKYDTINFDVRILSFADYLKRIIKDLFLVEDYYLNDDYGKTQSTQYKWEDMPCVILQDQAQSILGFTGIASLQKHFNTHAPNKILIKNNEYMTGRELMEYFGETFRKINPMAWVNGVVSQIKNTNNKTIFLVPDVRAPNEIKALKSIGAHIIRLTRDTLKRESPIETWLDRDKFDYNEFDYIIDNAILTLEEKNKLGLDYFLKAEIGSAEKVLKRL